MPDFSFNFLNHNLVVKVNEVAKRSETSVLVEYNDSVVLATICYKIPDILQTDFLPLTVQVNDNLFSKQRIPGSYNRRENKPSLSSTLTSRIIDRSMRPLFDKYFFGETQLLINPLSIKIETEPTFISFLAAAIALAVSSIPFKYCVAGLKFAITSDDKLIINPTILEQVASPSVGFLALTNNKIVMIDAEFNQLKNEKIMQHLYVLKPVLKKLEEIIVSIKSQIKKTKLDFSSFDFSKDLIKEFVDNREKFINILKNEPKDKKENLIDDVLNSITTNILNTKKEEEKLVFQNQINLYKEDYFRNILIDFYDETKRRFDGRTSKDIRNLSGSTNIIKQSHGSGYFVRGETEVLSIIVLESMDKKLYSDDVWHPLEYSSNYFLHYSFPAFSVGETYRIGPPKRRELGHGALAEKAISKVLSINDLKYTLRINCEVLSSNGSSSQASICATSLALFDAGIKTTGHIAGIALGLLTNSKDEKIILTDIEGWEDHYGEMDFKVAHTRKGVCSIQLDLKNNGISFALLENALTQGQEANNTILDLLYSIAPKHNLTLKDNVLKCVALTLPDGKTGTLIGPGGKNIKKILEDHQGLQLSVDDNIAFIYHKDDAVIQNVIKGIERLLGVVKFNVSIEAPIVKIEDYGIFVDINNVWALLHKSKLPYHMRRNIRNHYKLGDLINVTPIGRDEKGRLQVRINP